MVCPGLSRRALVRLQPILAMHQAASVSDITRRLPTIRVPIEVTRQETMNKPTRLEDGANHAGFNNSHRNFCSEELNETAAVFALDLTLCTRHYECPGPDSNRDSLVFQPRSRNQCPSPASHAAYLGATRPIYGLSWPRLVSVTVQRGGPISRPDPQPNNRTACAAPSFRRLPTRTGLRTAAVL